MTQLHRKTKLILHQLSSILYVDMGNAQPGAMSAASNELVTDETPENESPCTSATTSDACVESEARTPSITTESPEGKKRGLTAKDAIKVYMRKRARTSRTSSELAMEYGVTAKAVRDVWARKTWINETMPFWELVEEKPAAHLSSQGCAAGGHHNRVRTEPEIFTRNLAASQQPSVTGLSVEIIDSRLNFAPGSTVASTLAGMEPENQEEWLQRVEHLIQQHCIVIHTGHTSCSSKGRAE